MSREIRASELAEKMTFREPGMEPVTIKSLDYHGDAVLVTDVDGVESTLDRDTVVEVLVALPRLEMDVAGEYSGNAYPEAEEYRVHMRPMIGGERFLLTVENASGGEINSVPLSMAEVDGIQKVASTDHGLDVYEDDWTIPVNIERSIHWDLGDAENFVRLNEAHIDEIAAWLRYATGEETWDGGDTWEY
jgi:hypothetical protein